MNDIGLKVVEGIANGATSFKNPSKRNIGLLGQAIRGVPFVPTVLNAMEEFNTIFGGQSSLYFGPRMVKSIFDEAGDSPVTILFARAIGGDYKAAAASLPLTDGGFLTVKAGYKGVEDPGVWGNGLKVALYSYGFRAFNAFSFSVSLNGEQVENFTGQTIAEIQKSVNSVSRYVILEAIAELPVSDIVDLDGTVTTSVTSNEVIGVGTTFTELSSGTPLYDAAKNLIGTIATIVSDTRLILNGKALVDVTDEAIKHRNDVAYEAELIGGDDGDTVEADFYPIEGSDPKGLACFSGKDVQIVAVTEYHTFSMAKVLHTYVEDLKSPLGIFNLPLNADESLAELYAMEFQTKNTSYLAGYMGWAKVANSDGTASIIPAIAPLLGSAYLRTPEIQGGYVHIPPAGTDSAFKYVIDMIPDNLSQASVNRIVSNFTCNVIRYDETVGFYVGSSRTYSTNPLFQSIHTRQMMSYYRRVMETNMKYLEQKPNTPELRNKAIADISTYFKGEHDNGALERSVPFSTAFQVVCDRSNNPVTQDRKMLNIDVYLIFTECVESVKISLLRNDSVLTTITE